MTTRERILRALLDSSTEFVSGQSLATELGISRPAIWRHMAALKGQGYQLESVTGQGYRLLHRPDVLSKEEIACRLETESFGRALRLLDEVGSTNDEAKAWAMGGCPEGAAVVADMQTGGRGRRGRTWASPAGKGIYVSVVLRPKVAPATLGQLSLLMALATARAIRESTSLAVRTKWPNDVWVGGRKVAGILLEADADLEEVRSAVVGIGINVSLSAEDLPAQVRRTATSLNQAAGRAIPRAPLVCAVLRQMETIYRQFASGRVESLLDEYRALDACLGRPVTVEVGRQSLQGTAERIGDGGELILRMANGGTRAFVAGDVSLRPRGAGATDPRDEPATE
jgi:BirA family biotin operon repressor/biotin-[acetyl-CoA-carboxylase] ligase